MPSVAAACQGLITWLISWPPNWHGKPDLEAVDPWAAQLLQLAWGRGPDLKDAVRVCCSYLYRLKHGSAYLEATDPMVAQAALPARVRQLVARCNSPAGYRWWLRPSARELSRLRFNMRQDTVKASSKASSFSYLYMQALNSARTFGPSSSFFF